MLKLYDYPASQNGWKVRTLLSLHGTPYETVWVKIFGPRDPAFLKLNPMGAIPVLQLEDGRAIPESHAILCYLAEGTSYLPTDRFERAQALRWLFFEQDYVQASIATLRQWRQLGRAEANAALMPPREAPHHRRYRRLRLCASGRGCRLCAQALSRLPPLDRHRDRSRRAAAAGSPLPAGGDGRGGPIILSALLAIRARQRLV